MRTPPIGDSRHDLFLTLWETFCRERVNAGLFDWILHGFDFGISEGAFIKWLGKEKFDSFFAPLPDKKQE